MRMIPKIWALVRHTFTESFAKKTFIAFFAISSLVHIALISALNVDAIEAGLALVTVFGKEVQSGGGIDLHDLIIGVQRVIAFWMFFGGIFLSIFATASLMPTMLAKGNVELLVSKPLRRWQILLGRYLGAMFVMAFNVVYLIGGTWLILSIKTGIWYQPYLYSIPMVIVAFGIMYAVMRLVGITAQSAGVTVMVAYSLLFLDVILQQKEKIYALLSSKSYYYFLEVLYQVTPKTIELGQMNEALVIGRPVDDWTPLWTSCAVGLALLLSSTLIFSRKDF